MAFHLQSSKKRKKKEGGQEGAEDGATAAAAAAQGPQKLTAQSYTPPDPGPYPQDKPPENPVRFTPVQVGIEQPLTHTSSLQQLRVTN